MERKEWISRLEGNLNSVILGKPGVVEQVLTSLLAGGHILLEDVPGVGKTTLARALALKPEVLFLDNPLAGMDVHQTRWWRRFIGELSAGHPQFNRRPITIVVACEDLRPWLELGRQFALAHERRWRILGTREEVVASSEELVRDMMANVF